MKSVSNKVETLRTAVAVGTLEASPEAIRRLLDNDLPKKDVLIVARVAGVQAVKKTSELIPYCHPVPIDHAQVDYEVGERTITVRATVSSIAKTGVEMEALTSASVSTLTIYDMLKPVDKNMVISSIRLVEKTGGRSSYIEKFPRDLRAAVVVCSDSTAKGVRSDRSGRIIRDRLVEHGLAEPTYRILPDETDRIELELKGLVSSGHRLIVTTGGTGLGPRDVTVEATRRVIDREVPGIMEAARAHGQRRTPYSMLSRGLAGLSGSCIILNLPGSSRGTEESLDAVFPAVLHAYKMMAGGGH